MTVTPAYAGRAGDGGLPCLDTPPLFTRLAVELNSKRQGRSSPVIRASLHYGSPSPPGVHTWDCGGISSGLHTTPWSPRTGRRSPVTKPLLAITCDAASLGYDTPRPCAQRRENGPESSGYQLVEAIARVRAPSLVPYRRTAPTAPVSRRCFASGGASCPFPTTSSETGRSIPVIGIHWFESSRALLPRGSQRLFRLHIMPVSLYNARTPC